MALLALCSTCAHGALIAWKDTGSDWTNKANWLPSSKPPADNLTDDIASFEKAAYTFQPIVGIRSIAGIQVSGSGSLVLTTGNLSIGGNGIVMAAGAGAFSIGTVTIATTQTWTNASASLFTTFGNVVLSNDLTVAGSGSFSQTGGVMSGSGRLILGVGFSGTQTLTSDNPYSGGTVISGGTLLVNNTAGSGTGSGAVTVGAGSTLGGTGTVSGAVTVNGRVAPGSGGLGTLSVANGLTWNWNAGNAWLFDLGEDNTSDLLQISGMFVKGSITAGEKFFFDFNSAGVTGTFKLVDWTGSTTFTASDFSYVNLAAGHTGSFSISGGSLLLTVVPEPAEWALYGGLVAFGFGVWRRRR